MSEFSWLASYPKSGNTWFRMITANLRLGEGQVLDINKTSDAGIASARAPFDNMLLVDSALLNHTESDRMRPMVYQALARAEDGQASDFAALFDDGQPGQSSRLLVKVHDAWVYTDQGEALLGGAEAADNAILITRDPRDVAPSLANHRGVTIDAAIEFMGDRKSCSSASKNGLSNQLRQQFLGWSGHTESWLNQTEIPVHHVRYEDMKSDPVATIHAAQTFAENDYTVEEVLRAVDLSSFDRLKKQENDNSFREAPLGRPFFRRGESGGWRDELSADQVLRIERDHSAMMERLGYPLHF